MNFFRKCFHKIVAEFKNEVENSKFLITQIIASTKANDSAHKL